MNTISKCKTKAFGKDVYLLGKDKNGDYIWLEAASWDCDWYWGFGYIETYTNNKHPELSRDISSHSHWDSLVGKQEYYDIGKQCFRLSADYVHHLNENPNMEATVLTDKESWQLADLMKSYYTLKEAAEFYKHGNSYYTTTGIENSLINPDAVKRINEVELPLIFRRIYELLEP